MPKEHELWSIAARRWKLISLFVAGGLIVGIVLILTLPRQYRVQTTVLLVANNNTPGPQTGVARSLASVVGIGFGQDDMREEALALLRSDRLAWDFIARNQLASLLRPAKAPMVSEDEIRDRVLDRFKNHVLSVSDDRRTGLITLSILWNDRNQAAEWANSFVRLADEELRRQTLADSERTLDLLKSELEKTRTLELRNSINQFYESQLQRMVFARARDAFALRTIDPALTPAADNTATPKKKLILASSLLLAAMAGLLVSIVLEISRSSPSLSPADGTANPS